MYSLQLLQTDNNITFVKPKKRTSKVPRSISVYFILFLCIFGFDFGFKKTLSKRLRLMFSCVQLCVSIIMCIILIWQTKYVQSDQYVMTLVYTFQYLTHCTLLLFSNYNVYDLIIDVYTLDRSIMEAVNIKFAFMLYFYTMVTCGLKQTLCVVNCFLDSTLYCDHAFPSYWYCIPIIGIDSVAIIQMLVYYCVYRSVKYIKNSLHNFDIKTVQERYLSVVTYCDKIRPLNSALVSVVIVVFDCIIDDDVICRCNVSKNNSKFNSVGQITPR